MEMKRREFITLVCGAAATNLLVVTPGDAVHFKSNWENRSVPSMNVDKEKTAASMQLMADIMAKEKAQLWINHDKAQRDGLKMAPGFYD